MPSTFQRQPLAVMFTDIKGYTSLTSKDEMLALSLVDKKRSILEPLLKKHKGTFVKEMGDGTVTYFKTPAQAANCAIKLQQQSYDDENLNIRVGIHYGNTIIKNKDVFGDTVNIASRIESLAVAGGVFISKETRDKIKKPHNDISLGLQTMKGVGRLIEIYGLKGKQLSTPDPKDYEENKVSVHSDKEVPSIAILPFENKGKSKDEFYAHGIISDLITDISSAGKIRVASLKDIEKLEYDKLENDKIAKKLFVRYIAQGSLWRQGDIFQLSVELYDTKKNKIVWLDNWQESWEALPAIKINLSKGLLKTLDTQSKYQNKVDSNNVEAYEYYLRGKHIHDKRKNSDETEIARGLLYKAIELDDKLIVAKILLGKSYKETNEYDKAVEINNSTFKQSKKLKDNYGMIRSLSNIGGIYYFKGDFNKSMNCYFKALKICEKIDDKSTSGYILGNIGNNYFHYGNDNKALSYYFQCLKISKDISDQHNVGYILNNIGIVYKNKGQIDKALDCYYQAFNIFDKCQFKFGIGHVLHNIAIIQKNKGELDKALDGLLRALEVHEEIGNKLGIGQHLVGISAVYDYKGDFDKAMQYNERALELKMKIGDKHGIGHCLTFAGIYYKNKGLFKKAEEYLLKALDVTKKIGLKRITLSTTTHLYLVYKSQGKQFDLIKIHKLINEDQNIEFNLNYALYQLLEEISYLKSSYTQVMNIGGKLEKDIKTKFFSYPIPRIIVAEYKKLNN